MRLDSPLIALSDYALAAASIGFAVAVGRKLGPRNRVSGWLWCAAFIAAGIAAAAGGTFHGIETWVEPSIIRALWNIAAFSMGGCGAFIVAAVHAANVSRTDATVTWLVSGTAVTLFGAAVQQGVLFALVRWDPNLTYHLIQIAGLYFFFRCARTMHDRPRLTHGRS
jgi:hypothetical protein